MRACQGVAFFLQKPGEWQYFKAQCHSQSILVVSEEKPQRRRLAKSTI